MCLYTLEQFKLIKKSIPAQVRYIFVSSGAVRYKDTFGSYAIEKESIVPNSIIIKEPTAELKENQKDTDTLPPYDLLDIILKAYVEDDLDYQEIVKLGFDDGIVRDIINLVDKSEYKRRQSPPGIKITPKNFGRDRRLPIVNRYRQF